MQQHITPPGGARTVPVEDLGPRIAIHTPEFAADPHYRYRVMRREYGPLVPVELAPGLDATLIVDYRTAITILNDSDHFSADPRPWESTLTDEQRRSWSVFPMMKYRSNALRTNGKAHERYRAATTAALAGINQLRLQRLVEHTAARTVNEFCRDGAADLLTQYCAPVTGAVIATILGCTPEPARHLADASAALFDGRDSDTVDAMFDHALRTLTVLKRAEPGDDITTRLVNHPAGLTDDEMVQQLLTIISAAVEVPANLIANTVLLLLTDTARFTATAKRSVPPTTDAAIDETLITNPPMANYMLTYPVQPVRVGRVWLAAHRPVLVSMAAINDSAEINTGAHLDNRSHIMWGSGRHACPHPARSIARWMTHAAIDQLLDLLPIPDLRLAVPAQELTWRPGPFHRALTRLPVVFPATEPFPIL